MNSKGFLCKATIAFVLIIGLPCLNNNNNAALGQDTINPLKQEIIEEILTTVECSDIPHKGKVVISWITRDASFANPQIDYTVFKSGFKTGQFKYLFPLDTGIRSMQNPNYKLADKTNDRIPELFVGDIKKYKSNNSTVITIDGLEPGLTYFWRIIFRDREMISTKIFRVEGPICPLDDFKEKE